MAKKLGMPVRTHEVKPGEVSDAGRSEAIRRPVDLGLKAKGK
jgi:hypothetical protein